MKVLLNFGIQCIRQDINLVDDQYIKAISSQVYSPIFLALPSSKAILFSTSLFNGTLVLLGWTIKTPGKIDKNRKLIWICGSVSPALLLGILSATDSQLLAPPYDALVGNFFVSELCLALYKKLSTKILVFQNIGPFGNFVRSRNFWQRTPHTPHGDVYHDRFFNFFYLSIDADQKSLLRQLSIRHS